MANPSLLPDQNQEYPVPGLIGTTNYINSEKETNIVNYLDSRSWKNISQSATGRRVQHFGYEYSYSSRSVATPTSPLEGDILAIGQHLQNDGWLPAGQLQCIVNEYSRNQGISAHIDSTSFGPVVITISLLEDNVMTFSDGNNSYDIFLPRRGILILEGEARYNFKHSIASKVTYIDPNGQKVTKSPNYRRISLTYRTVN